MLENCPYMYESFKYTIMMDGRIKFKDKVSLSLASDATRDRSLFYYN